MREAVLFMIPYKEVLTFEFVDGVVNIEVNVS